MGPTLARLACLAILVAATPVLGAPSPIARLGWKTASAGPGSDSHVKAMAVDAAGDPVVVGTHSTGALVDWRIAKFDGGTGVMLWEAIHPGTDEAIDEPVALALDGAGNAIVASRSGAGPDNAGGTRLTKFAALDGATLWERSFTPPGRGAIEAIAVDAAGNVIAAGSDESGTGLDWKTVKYSADGAIVWEQTRDGPLHLDDRAQKIALDGDGNALVAGYHVSAAPDPAFPPRRRLLVVKYAADDGGVQWAGGLPDDWYVDNDVMAIAIDAAGNAFVRSKESFPSDGEQYARTGKLAAADGAAAWTRRDGITTWFDPPALFLAVDAAGDVYLAETAGGALAHVVDTNLEVNKYDGATGNNIWWRVLSGWGISPQTVEALSLDEAGHPVLTGAGFFEDMYSDPGSTRTDILAVGLDAADGHTRWTYGYDGMAGGTGKGRAVRTVPGAVLVAGDFLAPGAAGTQWQLLRLSGAPAPRAAPDFNADGKADFAFRHADGTTALWLMDGAATASIAGIFAAGSGVSIVATDDFDGNGTADLLWQLPQGYAVSLMDGATFVATAGILAAGTGWTPAMTADFDGDGKSDIVVRHTDGTHAVFVMDATAVARGFAVLAPGSGWDAERAGDFDGDGKADLVLRHASGTRAIAFIDGYGVSSAHAIADAGTGATIAQLADFDGDGRKDFLWKTPGGAHDLWLMNGHLVKSATTMLGAGSGWSAPLAADSNADGRDDLVVAHADGRIGIWRLNGPSVLWSPGILGPGSGWSVAALRDSNGDGHADLLLRHADGTYAIGLFDGEAMPTAAGVVGPPWSLVP